MFQALPAAIPEDKQVMLETCRGPDFLINWIKCASRWFRYNDIEGEYKLSEDFVTP
jgi:hypothetical protein